MPQLGQRKASASTGDYLLWNMDFPIQIAYVIESWMFPI